MTLKSVAKFAKLGLVAVLAAALSACGGFDGVDFNGKIFDAVGLNTGSVKSADPAMKERSPLVVPPNLQGLPQPGSGKVAAQSGDIATVNDHDAIRDVSRADLEKQQSDYCEKNYRKTGPLSDYENDNVAGPLGPCKGSLLTAIKGIGGGSEAADDE